MMSNEKTAGVVSGNVSGEEKKAGRVTGSFSKTQCNTLPDNRQDHFDNQPPGAVVTSLISAGAIVQKHAISSKRLAEAMGLEDIRSFREIASFERGAGALILGGSRGLYILGGGENRKQELRQHIRTTEARKRGLAMGLRPARRDLRRLENAAQLSMNLEDSGGLMDGEEKETTEERT